MNIIRRQPQDKKHPYPTKFESYSVKIRHYVFEQDKGIFVLTPKHLSYTLNPNKGYEPFTWEEYGTGNIPIYLYVYAAENRYTVLLINKDGDLKFLFNPHNMKIVDIDIELYKFLKENYGKI